MEELITNINVLPFWSKFADLHGFFAMLSLILFGASLVLFFLHNDAGNTTGILKRVLLALFINISILDTLGLLVYIPYRDEGGPRTLLKSSEATSWLHTIVFEHKEFLAFAPVVLLFAAYYVVAQLGPSVNDKKNSYLKKSVLVALILSLLFVLTVAAEAVLVTKVAPI